MKLIAMRTLLKNIPLPATLRSYSNIIW